MMQVVFKNLERSSLAIEACEERLGVLLEKFPLLRRGRLRVTLSMENSPAQAGGDLFAVTVRVFGGRYNGVACGKHQPSLYAALADVTDHMLEALNRHGDKARVRERKNARKLDSNRVNEQAYPSASD